jgi:hypothetical protein
MMCSPADEHQATIEVCFKFQCTSWNDDLPINPVFPLTLFNLIKRKSKFGASIMSMVLKPFHCRSEETSEYLKPHDETEKN